MNRSAHLVERAAALLRGGAGLTADLDSDRPAATPPPFKLAPATELPPLPPSPVFAPPVPSSPAMPPAPSLTEETPSVLEPANGVDAAIPAPVPFAAPEPDSPPVVQSQMLQQAGLVVTKGERTRIVEEYRITVSRIMRALRPSRTSTDHANLLLVTSSKPDEGKTFTALNLATSFAQTGQGEVLLIDTDAKPHSLSAQLGLAGQPGLLNLAGNPGLRAEDLVVRTAIDGLSLLPIGTATALPAGTLRPVSNTIERIARRFPHHLIVIDSAPCLSSSDPSTLAGMADQIVMVVEAERTQRNELESALSKAGAEIAGAE